MVLSNNSAQVCSFDSDINTGNIRLLATGDSADVDVSLQRVVLGSSTEAGDIAAAPVLDSVTNTSNIIAASANSVKTAYDVGIAGQTSAAAAYTNAVSYTDTKAAAAYSNATSYADTKAAAAYSNATSYADSRIIDSVTNTSITYAASANSVKNAYDRAIDANTRASSAQTSATDAYSNAIIFASNASNINTGTLAEARLPYRMNQNVQTTDTVEFAGLTLSGNLVVSGNVNIIGANNLSISDNMIYLNSNNDVSNPDLGFAGNYNDGTYHHAGFFRDASDGIWKVFDNYEPEPDASAFIDTTNTTFHIADFQTNTLFASSLSANGSLGTAGQVLTSNGTTLYWSTVSGGAGGFTNGQSISVNNFVITGAFSANSSNGTSGQVLTSNGTGTYWSTVSSSGNTGTTVVGSTQHSGSNSGIFIPATSQLEFGAGDFTIELFWYPISTGRQALYTGSVGTDYSIGIDYNSVGTNKLGIWASSTGTSWNIINADGGGNGIGTTTVPQNQWNHIAYTRSGSTWRLFLNGVPEVSVTSSATIVSRSAASKVIGQWFSATAMAPASGFISNFRAVKGVAVYTSAFTVPSLPLSVIANTVLLTAESVPPRDRSTNNLAVTGNNLTFATYSTSNVNIGITTGKAIAMALVFGG
jgi:hypothetical protein